MIDKCPDCGAKITLEPTTAYRGHSVIIKLLHKFLRSRSRTGVMQRGQFVFTCKSCGKSGLICVD